MTEEGSTHDPIMRLVGLEEEQLTGGECFEACPGGTPEVDLVQVGALSEKVSPGLVSDADKCLHVRHYGADACLDSEKSGACGDVTAKDLVKVGCMCMATSGQEEPLGSTSRPPKCSPAPWTARKQTQRSPGTWSKLPCQRGRPTWRGTRALPTKPLRFVK